MTESDMSNTASAETSAYEQARSWFAWLYGDRPEGKIWVGGHANGFKGVLCADPESAAREAVLLDQAGEHTDAPWGVYHRLTTMHEVAGGRGSVEDSVSLPALMIDLDLRGPGHVSDRYPETASDLTLLLADAGLPEPSAWVDSGGGRYAVWRLDKPMGVGVASFPDDPLLAAQEGSRALQRAVIDAGKARGWKIDNTSDLARIFRVPGTTNRKAGGRKTASWSAGGTERWWGYPLADLKPQLSGRTATIGHPSATSEVADDSDGAGFSFGGLASLFGSAGAGAASGGRGFTVAEAMVFVRPALDALRTAGDGEINVRLNAAACALAHFGPEFWDETAADAQLESALGATAYDGVTWKAPDTIASARRAMGGDWRGVLVPTTPEQAVAVAMADGDADPVAALLAEMISFSDVAAIPAPRYLIHGLLQFDSESWIIGAPGSKKSFVALDIAARVARGEKTWQGRDVNPADVVMIVAEGAGGMGKRVAAWRKMSGDVEGLRVLPRPVQSTVKVMGSTVVSPEWQILALACARLADSARERGRGLLVVIDTQARVTVGLNENAAEDMGFYIEAVRLIRERTAACVLTVHHTGRKGGDARGSNAIDGAQTTELRVDSKPKTLTGYLVTEKQKDIDEIESIRLGFESVSLGLDGDGRPVSSLVLADQESVAFKAAWAGITPESVESDEQAKVTPFKFRASIDAWIVSRDSRAIWQHRIVQAIVDTAGTLGLTQSEVHGMVIEKYGEADTSSWRKAWQKVTDESGRWVDVVRSAGGQRWTVDPIGVSAAQGDNGHP